MLCSQEQIRINEDRQHAQRLMTLDEAHSSHIGRMVVDPNSSFESLETVFTVGQIELKVFNIREHLMPFANRFDIHGPKIPVTTPAVFGNEMASNETAGATKDDEIVRLDHK